MIDIKMLFDITSCKRNMGTKWIYNILNISLVNVQLFLLVELITLYFIINYPAFFFFKSKTTEQFSQDIFA